MGGRGPESGMNVQEIIEASDMEGLTHACSCEGEDAVMSWQWGAKSADHLLGPSVPTG